MTRHIDPEALAGHLLGEATDASSAAIGRHLEECATCRRQASALRFLIRNFADATAPHPGAAILDSLLTAQRRIRSGRRHRALPGGLFAAGTVAAVLGIFAAGFWTGRQTSPGPPDSKPTFVVRDVVGRARNHDLAVPQVMFVAAIPDRVAGLAKQDTTTN